MRQFILVVVSFLIAACTVVVIKGKYNQVDTPREISVPIALPSKVELIDPIKPEETNPCPSKSSE